MATIHKCDKCNKIIKNDNSFSVSIYDRPGLLEEKLFPWSNFHLCEKCAKPFAVYLKKILAKKFKIEKIIKKI